MDAAQAENLSLASFQGEKCYMGLDLGAKTDLAAKVLLFPRNGKFYAFPKYYLPDAAVHDGRNSQYKGWAIEGRLSCTDGNILDYDEIERDIASDLTNYAVADIGIDPWESTQLVQKLLSQGAVVTEVMQTVAHLSEPTKTLDAWSRGDLLRYDCPILLWCASNVVVREDTNGNIKPNKMAPAAKIDGVIALILAIARYLVAEDAGSVYEERPLLVF
jgi:phage terminase large subunit-like protein